MGIRPHIELICGINDLQTKDYQIVDARFSGPKGWSENVLDHSDLDSILKDAEAKKSDLSRSEWQTVMNARIIRDAIADKDNYDLISWDPEYGLPNVIGYVVDDLYATDLAYALAVSFGQENPCAIELPKYEIKDTIPGVTLLPAIEHAKAEGKSLFSIRNVLRLDPIRYHLTNIRMGWMYKGLADSMAIMYVPVASYLFKKFGLKVPPRDLKLMIYCYWS